MSADNVYPFVGLSRSSIKLNYHPRNQNLRYKNGFQVSDGNASVDTDFEDRLNSIRHSVVSTVYDNVFNESRDHSSDASKPFVPQYVALDKKVLCFNAYFDEFTGESPSEVHRVHPVNIFYYLIDDKISVVEEDRPNSGLQTGRIFWKQKVPKTDTQSYFHWRDFNLGIDVNFYGRVYRIVDCDEWTKSFYESSGFPLNPSEPLPPDPHAQKSRGSTYRQPKEVRLPPVQKRNDFDRNWWWKPARDNSILQFLAAWNDQSGNHYNRTWRRHFKIQYFVEDSTVAIVEFSPTTRDDTAGVFLKRQKLPKSIDFTSGNQAPIIHEAMPTSFYSDADFGLGKWIIVYGRPMVIYAVADVFTVEYYLQKFGSNYSNPLDVQTLPSEPQWVECADRKMPEKLLFLVAAAESESSYVDMMFLLYVYPDDKTLAIYEMVPPKSQRLLRQSTQWCNGRLFLDRCSAPGIFDVGGDESEWLCRLSVGTIVQIFRWKFCILDSDETTKAYVAEAKMIVDATKYPSFSSA